MDQQQPERTGGGESAGTRAEWKAPLVDKLIAGGAQANAGGDVEGLDGMS